MFLDSERIEKLETLVSLLFNIPYNIIKGNINILNNEKLTNSKKQKKGAMDVYFNLTLLNGNYRIDIEVSSKILSSSTINRNISYLSYITSNQLRSSQNYNLLKPSIVVCLDKGLSNIKENNKIINIYELRDKYSNKLTNKLQFWHINIENCYKIWYSNNINKYEKEEQNIILIGALLCTTNINEFNKCLRGISMDDKVKKEIKETNEALNEYDDIMSWYDYDRDQLAIRNGDLLEAKENGIKEGIEKGTKQTKLETAKKLKILNVDINTISQATNLTLDEINRL